MKRDKLHYLLTRYLQQRSDKKELKELQTLLTSVSDNEFEEILLAIWDKEQYKMCFPSSTQFRSMADAIKHRTLPAREKRRYGKAYFYMFRTAYIAAAVLLTVFLGYTVHMSKTLQKLKKYSDREIVMSVAAGQQAKILLPDGTSVRLNAESTLSYPYNFGVDTRKVKLNGEAYFEVARDRAHPFTVHTSYLDIEVLGTVFNVCAYNDSEKEEMTLFSGSVLARSVIDPDKSVLVRPNQKVACNKETGNLVVSNVDPVYETGWLTGDLIFRSEKLIDIFRKLERRYDVSITFSGDPALLEDKFTGRIGSQNITEAMDILCMHYRFVYRQKGKDIMISIKK